MRKPYRISRLAGVLIVVASAAFVGGTGAATAQPHSPGSPSVPQAGPPGARSATLRLITGDIARLTTMPDGRQSAVLVGQASENRPYSLSVHHGDVHLIPTEAMPYVSSGQLDERLFNLTLLAKDGYADRPIPVLLSAPQDGPAAKTLPRTPQAAARTLPLHSVSTLAVTPQEANARAFWESIDDDSPHDGSITLASGVGKVWLDARVHVTLDESVPRVGAPAAWAAGYDGKGVKVAVLDTGYDPDHPDLANKVATAKSFVPGEIVTDRHGHGTHVASTIAGSGAVSDGSRKGVAPGAQLLVGKVLSDSGRGAISWIIAGMEWAVESGAKVINMSLGSPALGETDPTSQAVEELSARSGALFVIAAGNAGPDNRTLGTPGIAGSALTVGAVDKQGSLASFSSRGPRPGDGAVKPEVTAPGVAIVAARAAGTSLGQDVSQWYTGASGTSMATPHVAGAAAIMAQRYPQWSGSQIKNALVSSAVPAKNVSASEQGTGHIDVAAALTQSVRTSSSTLSFGGLGWTGAPRQPVIREVTYTNASDKPLGLELDLEVLPLAAGSRARADLTVAHRTLSIPPGGSATTSLRLNPDATEAGSYAGYLVARGPNQALIRTAIGFTVGSPTHKLTVAAIDRHGQPAQPIYANTQLWNVDTGQVVVRAFDSAGRRTWEVPTGRYAVMAHVGTPDRYGEGESITMLGEPDLTVTSSMHVTLDARQAEPLRVASPKPADRHGFILAWHRTVEGRSALAGWQADGRLFQHVYVQRFAKVKFGTFQVAYRADLAQPQLIVDVTGPGGFRLATPRHAGTPVFVGDEHMRVVDGGNGTPEELARPGVQGAAVLIRWGGYSNAAAQAKAAADAGAKLVFLHNDGLGYWSPVAGSATIPVYGLDQLAGRRLSQHIAGSGTADVRLQGVPQSGYHYELMATEPTVKGPLEYQLDGLEPATVTTDFQLHRKADGNLFLRAAYVPGINVGFEVGGGIIAPAQRIDYLVTRDITWVDHSFADASQWKWLGEEYSLPQVYRKGDQVARTWWPAIVRPAVSDVAGFEDSGMPVARFEDAIRVAIPQFVSGDGRVYGWGDGLSVDSTELILRREGVEVGRSDWSSVWQFAVPSGSAAYELEMNVQRLNTIAPPGPPAAGEPVVQDLPAPPPLPPPLTSWATTSTRTHTVWKFQSAHAAGRAVLPLLQIDYALATDPTNRLAGNLSHRLLVKPGYQPGYRGPGGFHVTAEVSYDNGQVWIRVPAAAVDGAVTVTLPEAPPGASCGSIRLTATDSAGNAIEQAIECAWLVTSP